MSEDFDKYLGIANHDIQMANNMGELKSYVANILYDNDKKAELLQQRDNIIKEVREYIEEKVPQSLCLPNGVYDMRRIDKTELLNILKGSDKE